MRMAAMACAMALSVSAAARAQNAQNPTMAVIPLRVERLQSNEAENVNEVVRERAAQRYDVQAKQTTTDLLEASKTLGVDCDVNAVTCGARLGTIADVAFVLVGSAVGVDGAVGVDLRIVDVKLAVEVRRVSGLVPTEPEAQTAAVASLADVLFSSGGLGALTVRAAPEGAAVVVDGVPRGLAPLDKPITTLAPGPHHVLVHKKGFLSQSLKHTVTAGETHIVEIALAVDPEAVQPAPSTVMAAMPWVTLGVGAATAIGGAVITAFGSQSWYEYEAQRELIQSTVNAGADNGLDDIEIGTISEAYAKADSAKREWESSGQGMVIGGAVMIGIGVAAAAAGTIWGITSLE